MGSINVGKYTLILRGVSPKKNRYPLGECARYTEYQCKYTTKTISNAKTQVVVCGFYEEITLPSYIAMITIHYKDSYGLNGKMDCHWCFLHIAQTTSDGMTSDHVVISTLSSSFRFFSTRYHHMAVSTPIRGYEIY